MMKMSKNPVTELANDWFEVEGIEFDRKQYGYIGKLYKEYGFSTVTKAINKVKGKRGQAKGLRNPHMYLRGICRQIGASEEVINHEGREKLDKMFKGMFN